MDFDFFLLPMLVPMFLPIFYCIKYKRESLAEIVAIILTMTFIVIAYWPLSNLIITSQNILVKIILFIILPIIILFTFKHDGHILNLGQFGIRKNGLKKSLWLCALFLPIMLGVTFVIKYFNGTFYDAGVLAGTISFFEAFSEEFFFRGVLFIFLLSRTNLKIAYITSLASFILMHPPNVVKPTRLGSAM